MELQWYICPTGPRVALMAMFGDGRWMLAFTLILSSKIARAHDDDAHHDGYTFVVDDLVWSTVFILFVVLIIWAYCAIFTSPDPTPCRQCTAYSPRDPVVRVRIEPSCAPRPCPAYQSTQQHGALTRIKSDLDGPCNNAPTLKP